MPFVFSTALTRYAALVSLLLLTIAPRVPAQDVFSQSFEQSLAAKTVTLDAINPYDGTPGTLTVSVTSGHFQVKRIGYGPKTGWTVITGDQEGSLKFVPYDTSKSTFIGDFKFELSGEIPFDRHSDALPLNFIIKTVGSDGSQLTFTLGESATVNEYGADVSFGELQRLISHPR
ncbi:MAG TPA: hypothetical protein VK208_13225 [Pyrinomonadaceae bacterium]|jgi:hypothetical protein|nr:hypothetical protein [Pyrinomonadaceae bacterium]